MFTILSVFIISLCLLGEPTLASEQTNRKFQASLITVSNEANAPFYYHTSLKLTVFNSLTNECVDEHSYAIYPGFSRKSKCLMARLYRFLRPFWACESQILSPDPLLEGRGSKIPPGDIIYREDYTLTAQDYENLQDDILGWELPYSYWGWFNTDNCSSWVRRLLNKYYFSNSNNNSSDSNCDTLTCNRYYFRMPKFLGGAVLRVPVLPFDFPKLCHSDSQISKHFLQVFEGIKPASDPLVTALGNTTRR